MKLRWSSITGGVFLSLFVLLIVIYWGFDYLDVPEWLQIAGRMHPLILHLPIGTFIGCVVLYFGASQQKESFSLLYDITILSALMAAIAGLFLAKSGVYEPAAISWHMHLGVAFASWIYISKIWILKKSKILTHLILGIGGVLLILSGHKGAEITHGKYYLFPENKIATEVQDCAPEGNAYLSLIQPIFDSKCVGCHGPQKRKAGLSLIDSSQIEMGADNGPIIDRAFPSKSKLLTMIHLPIEDEDHMPPEGKPQLTVEEISLLQAWIGSVASYNRIISSYEDTEIFINRCAEMAELYAQKDRYTFPSASSDLIQSIRNEYLSLQPLSAGSPALVAGLFVPSQYHYQYLENLLKVKDQLVHLDLSYMPLEEKDLNLLKEFKSLENLSLNYIPVNADQLLEMGSLPHLQSLSLAGTGMGEGLEKYLDANPGLKDVYLGTTGIIEDRLKQWKDKYPSIAFHYELPTDEILPLAPPIVANAKDIYQKDGSITLTSPVPGSQIKYTLDGSIPDSINGMDYIQSIPIRNVTKVKAVAIKEGWTTSPMVEYTGFLQGVKPDSVVLRSSASKQYPGEGVNTFFNDVKGEVISLREKKWIAFRDEPMILDMYFDDGQSIDSFVLSYGERIPAYVFPPSSITLSVKGTSGNWEKLADYYPEVVTSEGRGITRMHSIILPVKNIEGLHFRLEVQNLPRIPSWHPGKGEKGWLFVDEVFIY